MQEIAVVIALLAALCYGGWRTETSPKEEKSRLLA